MNHFFLDTNFVIDYFIRQDFQGDAEKFLTIGRKNQCRFFISYLTVANFAYIMRKIPSDDLKSLIIRICSIFTVVENNADQIQKAIALEASDFEDILQYQAALDAGCDCIITRNEKDFAFSSIPVMSASAYLQSMS